MLALFTSLVLPVLLLLQTSGPLAQSVTPSSGTGNSQTFAVAVSHPAGGTISQVYVIFNNALNGAPACYLSYLAARNTLWLMNDAGSAWQGPIPLGSGTVLSNSQCSLNTAAASAISVGNQLTINLPVTFRGTFSGPQNVYVFVSDTWNQNSGWQVPGTWTIPQPSVPAVQSVIPSSGSGRAQTFAVTVSAPPPAIINQAYIIINDTLTGAPACYLTYLRVPQTLWLMNDQGTAWEGPASIGSGARLSNRQCSLDTSHATWNINGYQLTIYLPLAFTSSFSGVKTFYVLASDDAGGSSGWQSAGSWTVTGGDDHPNNCDGATNVGVSSSTPGEIESGGDLDFFRIQLARAGAVNIATTGETDTFGTLRDSSCNTIVENDDQSSGDLNFRIVTRALNAGTYYVSVRHYDAMDGTGAYTLVVSTIEVPLSRLTVTKSGSGTGSVTSSPPGIDCGSACVADYGPGTEVILTATAAAGGIFGGWSGACTGTGTCTITMDANKAVTATFVSAANLRRLTILKSGTAGLGTGAVTSTPAGIDCGSTCTASFAVGAQVSLTASPDEGSVFSSWTSCESPGGEGGPTFGGGGSPAPCRITMDRDKTITATFRQQTFNLHVDRIYSGGGSLTVRSEPSGIACPSICDHQFPAGTVVTLTATPSASTVFAGWAEACTGASPTCTLLMDGHKTVKAYYGYATPPPPPTCNTAPVTITVSSSYGVMTWLNIQGVGSWVIANLSRVTVNNVPRGVYTLTVITTLRGTQSQSINVGCVNNLVVFR
jgi:hypothetical protein